MVYAFHIQYFLFIILSNMHYFMNHDYNKNLKILIISIRKWMVMQFIIGPNPCNKTFIKEEIV